MNEYMHHHKYINCFVFYLTSNQYEYLFVITQKNEVDIHPQLMSILRLFLACIVVKAQL